MSRLRTAAGARRQERPLARLAAAAASAIGLRPINALVDITDFITYDRGRPLHVFDAGKVHGNLTVRRANNGETVLALDGKTYTLEDGMCVIADEKAVESLAGIMGGEATGCAEAPPMC